MLKNVQFCGGVAEYIRRTTDYDELIREQILDLALTRDAIAESYAYAILQEDVNNPIKWREINASIMRRWSDSALRYVKRRAWRIVKARARKPTSRRT